MSETNDPDKIFAQFCFRASGFLVVVLIALFAAPVQSMPGWWIHAITATIAMGIPCFVTAAFLMSRMDKIRALRRKPSRHFLFRLLKVGFYSLILNVTLILLAISPYVALAFFIISIGLSYFTTFHIITQQILSDSSGAE